MSIISVWDELKIMNGPYGDLYFMNTLYTSPGIASVACAEFGIGQWDESISSWRQERR